MSLRTNIFSQFARVSKNSKLKEVGTRGTDQFSSTADRWGGCSDSLNQIIE